MKSQPWLWKSTGVTEVPLLMHNHTWIKWGASFRKEYRTRGLYLFITNLTKCYEGAHPPAQGLIKINFCWNHTQPVKVPLSWYFSVDSEELPGICFIPVCRHFFFIVIIDPHLKHSAKESHFIGTTHSLWHWSWLLFTQGVFQDWSQQCY